MSNRQQPAPDESPDERHGDWEVVQGGIGVGVPAPQPGSGLMLNLAVDRLDTDAWRTLAASSG